ncbi:MAG TPA: hypothetical protein VNC61_17370, partial [Acidimicrobiales bacterium]|nr:hypothetical protein [Acidimicrobiales bacterium]
MSHQLKSFEGPDVQLVLDRIRREFGPDAKIDGAKKIRVGGVLGFFAKEHYQVVVEVPDLVHLAPGPAVTTPTPDERLSRRQRRRAAQSAATRTSETQATSGTAPFIAAPSPVGTAGAELGADVFSAMAESTDDVNDVAIAAVAAPPEKVEAFDAVLSRVAHSLGDAPADVAPLHVPDRGRRPVAEGVITAAGTASVDGATPDVATAGGTDFDMTPADIGPADLAVPADIGPADLADITSGAAL